MGDAVGHGAGSGGAGVGRGRGAVRGVMPHGAGARGGGSLGPRGGSIRGGAAHRGRGSYREFHRSQSVPQFPRKRTTSTDSGPSSKSRKEPVVLVCTDNRFEGLSLGIGTRLRTFPHFGVREAIRKVKDLVAEMGDVTYVLMAVGYHDCWRRRPLPVLLDPSYADTDGKAAAAHLSAGIDLLIQLPTFRNVCSLPLPYSYSRIGRFIDSSDGFAFPFTAAICNENC